MAGGGLLTLLILAGVYFLGVGIHALWNGTLVALAVVEAAVASNGSALAYSTIALTFTALLGTVLAATLWRVAGAVAGGPKPVRRALLRARAADRAVDAPRCRPACPGGNPCPCLPRLLPRLRGGNPVKDATRRAMS